MSDLDEFKILIKRAHAGEHEAIGQLLELYRQYLRTIARRKMGSMLNPRLDISDIVQQTLINAHEHFHGFVGHETAELQAWLRQILHNNVATAIRDHLYTKKRALTLEKSLHATDSRTSSSHSSLAIPSTGPTPSMSASKIEESLRLLDQIDHLPEDQAMAIKLRFLECRSIADVAEQLGRSKTAAAGLVKRGMQALRQRMRSDD